MKLPLKPFSSNAMWRGGKRYRTKEYLAWQTEGLWCLKGYSKREGEVEIHIKAYMKRVAQSDVDNVAKPVLDLLVKAGILVDDRFVKKLVIEKFGSGEEYLEIEIIGSGT